MEDRQVDPGHAARPAPPLPAVTLSRSQRVELLRTRWRQGFALFHDDDVIDMKPPDPRRFRPRRRSP